MKLRAKAPVVKSDHCASPVVPWEQLLAGAKTALSNARRRALPHFGHIVALPQEPLATQHVQDAADDASARELVGSRLAEYLHQVAVTHTVPQARATDLCAWWRLDTEDAPSFDDYVVGTSPKVHSVTQERLEADIEAQLSRLSVGNVHSVADFRKLQKRRSGTPEEKMAHRRALRLMLDSVQRGAMCAEVQEAALANQDTQDTVSLEDRVRADFRAVEDAHGATGAARWKRKLF